MNIKNKIPNNVNEVKSLIREGFNWLYGMYYSNPYVQIGEGLFWLLLGFFFLSTFWGIVFGIPMVILGIYRIVSA